MIGRELIERLPMKTPLHLLARGAAVALAAALGWSTAYAQDFHDRHDHDRHDDRFRHDHFYPSIGFSVGVLPDGYFSVNYGRGRYFFQGGVWYQRIGHGYVVVRPPVGVAVPVLPPGYTVVPMGGVPYYYVNDTYYVQGPSGYVVAQAPVVAGAAPPQAMPAPMAAQPAPMPQPVPAPQAAPAPGAPGQAPGTWYYCDSARAYYPYIQQCAEGFRGVPAPAPPR
jgi:hypothetical protein